MYFKHVADYLFVVFHIKGNRIKNHTRTECFIAVNLNLHEEWIWECLRTELYEATPVNHFRKCFGFMIEAVRSHLKISTAYAISQYRYFHIHAFTFWFLTGAMKLKTNLIIIRINLRKIFPGYKHDCEHITFPVA